MLRPKPSDARFVRMLASEAERWLKSAKESVPGLPYEQHCRAEAAKLSRDAIGYAMHCCGQPLIDGWDEGM